MYKILSINPGSTSTKIALYDDEKEVFVETLRNTDEELAKFERVKDQFEFRKKAVMGFLEKNNFNINDLSAVVGRGGLLPPVKSGAYKVNDVMVDVLLNRPRIEHASNLAALIAYEITKPLGIPAFIYDSIAVDELQPVAKISGMPEIVRESLIHTLNMRASAISTAKKLGKEYKDCKFVVAHLGGGVSLSVQKEGKMIDVLSDDEGPFSPERSGRVPCRLLMNLCYSDNNNKKTMIKKLRGNGGLKGYLGTVSAIEVEKMIEAGDEKAKLVYEAMAYQVAKGIGELATVVKGDVDAIILTGGIAHSKLLTGWIKERVEFIAPVEILPGENEMESLSLGALRVLRGEEEAREYTE